MEVNFKVIEAKWQKEWEKRKVFEVKEGKGKKCYVLEMYPYPSASFLHMGHVRNYTIGDVYARLKRMNGFNVLYPMGYDSFGLPAENAAKKEGIHPKKYAETSIKKIMEYQKALGNSYDWSRVIASHDENYYKWNQYFFLKLYEKGLAYRKKAPVNWCEKCESVLANEEAEAGKCWRCGNEVVKRDLEQWFFKITDYADRLLADLDKVEWPERIKIMQENWIGRSEGVEINFLVGKEKWKVFTTRPDTIYGVTFMVISLQHPKLFELVDKKNMKQVEDLVEKAKKIKTQEEIEKLDKEGVFTGSYAVNPLTNEKVPVYAGNFVLADYGSGMVMAVPGHDQRDFEFAKKYGLKIKEVIAPSFILSGKNAPRKDVETLERRTVTAVIEHWKENKFLLLKEPDDFILVGGGIEKNESPEEAIKREVKEETGYLNFEIKKVLANNLFCLGFRYTKNKNQKTNDVIFHIKLKNDKKIKSEVEDNKHDVVWIDKENVLEKITWEHHRFIWNMFARGEDAYVNEGILVNSGKFSGINSEEAKEKISDYLEKQKLGKRVVNYKIRDWLISRQRYWGTPIPIIYCEKCGIVPVPEKDLPVKLPEKVKFRKENPLLSSKEFVNVKCPKCKGKARRETDTMGGFVDSSWYFLRYCDNKNKKKPFDEKKVNYWMPVNQYIGGAEHAVMHLMYARFFIKALKDLGFVKFDEPFLKLFNQGIVYKDGKKMSKSYGNVVFQTQISNKYGIDTARLFLMFVSNPGKDMEWSEEGIEGAFRIINKLIALKEKIKNEKDEKAENKINLAIKKVTENIESFEYPKAVIALIEALDYFSSGISKKNYEILLKLISPFCPHISEELWHELGNKSFISLAEWPKAGKIDEKFEKIEAENKKLIEDINNILKIVKGEKIYIYALPNEVNNYNNKEISKRVSKEIFIFAVNDKNKYDPKGKAGKAKPGKPAIFVE